MTNKNVMSVFAIVAVAAMMGAASIAPAFAEPPAKVPLCHVNSGNETFEIAPGLSVVLGNVVEVSENSVDAHVENHGDSTAFNMLNAGQIAFLEDNGIAHPNADCWFLLV